MLVIEAATIAFPSYDGNGMFPLHGQTALPIRRSAILFIAFDRPSRLRLQGRAEIVLNGPETDWFKEVELVVRVAVSEVWMNCLRYVHHYENVSASRYVPRAETETPLREWKRIEGLEDMLRPKEDAAVAEAGEISREEWIGSGVAR